MKLHYKGKYNLDPDSLPARDHMPGAVKFKEAEDSKKLSIIANGLAVLIMAVLAVPAVWRAWGDFDSIQFFAGYVVSMLTVFPHELLHAICFKEDVFLYTNTRQGMLFVVGPEAMTKSRYIFMSLFPNIVFGLIPYIIGMLNPSSIWLLTWGVLSLSMGAGDYYNVYNAITQMPKGAMTYLHKFNSYWYIP